MSIPSNGFNITNAGLVKFDGSNIFDVIPLTNHYVLIGDVSNGINSISPDTADKVLTSNGPSSPPSFQTAPIGSMVLLDTQVASSSTSINFTTGISSTYDTYFLISAGITVSTGALITIQLSTDGGSSYISTGYQGGQTNFAWNSATATNHNVTTGMCLLRPTNTIQNSCQCWLYLPQSDYPTSNGQASSANTQQVTMGAYNTQITPNAFKIIMASGNFSGTFYLFGVAK